MPTTALIYSSSPSPSPFTHASHTHTHTRTQQTAYRVQTVVTLDGLRVRMHDYARAALGKVVNRGDRHRAIVKAFAEHGGRQVGERNEWVGMGCN